MRIRFLIILAAIAVSLNSIAAGANSASRDVTIGDKELSPQTIDIDDEGNIYVGGGREIWVFNPQGERTAKWQFPSARPIRVSPDGKVYVGRTWEPDTRLRVFDKNGQALGELGINKWLHGDAVGFDVPTDAAFDSNGNLWSVNTHHTEETEANHERPNTAWNRRREDPNGGRIMFFDLKKDPEGRKPEYFGTFSNQPPEEGGPADALHLPTAISFDPVHEKLFVLDAWGITRWNWPDGEFEKRIVRKDIYHGRGLLAVTPKGTLYARVGSTLDEYDTGGNKLGELSEIDARSAQDLRVGPDGAIYICSNKGSDAGTFKKYAPNGDLLLARGLNVISLRLSIDGQVYEAGQRVPVDARIEDREELYKMTLPGLDEVERSLWLRPYKEGARWQRMEIRTDGDGAEFFVLPEGVSGACELRLSASPVAADLIDGTAASVTIRLAVRSQDAAGTISVCADRGQQMLSVGEWVRINIIGRSAEAVAEENVAVQLVNPNDAIAAETEAAWSIDANSSATIPLDLRLPMQGTWRLVATSQSLGRAELTLPTVESREAGRFKMFTALCLGQPYATPATRAIVRIAAQDGITHDVTRYISAKYSYGWWGDDLGENERMRNLLQSDPRLPAPETAEQPTRIRAAVAEMNAGGMRLWPEMMGWEADTINRTEKQKIADKQDLSRWTQLGVKSPAQDGFLWNESNWWGVDQKRFKQEWSKATGNAIDQLEGISWHRPTARDPYLTGEKLEAALSYHEYAAKTLYPGNYRKWNKFVESIRPDSFSAGVPALYWCNWPEWAAEPLDGVMSYHQDEQVCEPYMQLNDCAMMKHDGKPFWAGVEMYPDPGTGEYIERQLLPALLYGVEGLWANDMGSYQKYMEGEGRTAQRHQAVGDMRAVLEPVGTRLRATEYLPELGIYYPRTEFVQCGNIAWPGPMYNKRVSAALIASFHAHIPAKVVFDEDMKANRFAGLKYLLIPGLQSELTDADRASLDRFKQQGGVILLSDGTAPRYADLGTEIDLDLDVFNEYSYVDWYANDTIIKKRLDVLALAERMLQVLAPYVQPPVQIDDPDIWFSLRHGTDNSGRPVTYFISVNQNYPECLNRGQLWKMTSMYDVILPVARTARVPQQYRYAYDLLRGEAIELADSTVELDFRRFAANVIALSTERLTAADLRQQPAADQARALEATVAPNVDVFMGQDINAALNADRPVFVVSQGRREERQAVIDALTEAGLDARPSQKIEEEEGVHVVVTFPNDAYWRDRSDMLPLRLTENVPGTGRAMLSYTRAYLPPAEDAIVLASVDQAGLEKGIRKLQDLKNTRPQPESRLIAPEMLPARPASLEENTITRWGARLSTIKAAGNTIAAGAAEWGNNLFVLDANTGSVRAAAKAGRYYVDNVWLSDDGTRIGAEAIYPEDVNAYLELFTADGAPLGRFARDGITSHGNRSYFNHTIRRDIFSFALSPDGPVVYSCSNAGLSAIRQDGELLWRHNYEPLQTDLDLLQNKWSGLIDLTPDGRYLAVGLTHEVFVGSKYRGISKVQLVEAATGRIVWEKAFEPIQPPKINRVAISPDGRTIAVTRQTGLSILSDGKIIRERSDAANLAWNKTGTGLFILARTDSKSDIAGENAVLMLDTQGIPQWQYRQAEPIVALAPTDDGGLVIADAARRIMRLTPAGESVWTIREDSIADVCVDGDFIFTCDWHGNISKRALTDGKTFWTVNVTDRAWRDDIESLPAQPYAGKTFGAPQRRRTEQPLAGQNVAPDAKVSVGLPRGWFASGKVLIPAEKMTNGELNDLDRSWLNVVDQYKSDNWGHAAWIELSWPEPVTLAGLAIHEDEQHPESWPYDCCVQIWKDGAWQDLTVSQMCPGPWHNIEFDEPQTVRRIRYHVTSILTNNLWTDEIRAIRAE